jgi:DUF1009 family protein
MATSQQNNPPPLGILAGGGTLPRLLADTASHQGRRIFIVAFQGQTEPETVSGYPHIWVRLGQAGETIKALKKAEIVDLVMGGAIRRPSFSELGLDWHGAQLFARIGARALGDDSMLRAVIRELEAEGFNLVGVDKILSASPLTEGILGAHAPDEQALADIARGVRVAHALGSIDVGQSVVVQLGLVLGVEAIEGTDALLQRAGTLRRAGAGGVLVKIVKPSQDRRADLPTIGPKTIELALEAGLRGIAIEMRDTIILDRNATIAAADCASLFLIAIDPLNFQ